MRSIREFLTTLCLLIMVLSAVPAGAQTNQVIYDDALRNGWENWSWATVSLANKNPRQSGSNSIKVTPGAWEALYVHHGAFSTTGFTSISFWVHGGSTGGQTLFLAGLLNDTAQAPVTVGPLTANAWQQVTIPLSALAVDNKSNCTGFWLQEASGLGQPTFYVDDIVLQAVPLPSVVNVTVNASSVLRTVDKRHFGLNTAIWDPVLPDPTSVSLLKSAGVTALRFPGGSLSDEYNWETGKSGGTTWATTFDEFAGVATAIGADVFITANYGSDTPAHAADWVRYSNITKGYGFKYWEIGNETYGSWETDNNTRPHDPQTYATRFKQYYDQMKAVDPTIKIGAVVINGEDNFANYADLVVTNPRTGQQHSGWTPVVLTTLKNLGVTPDFVAYHVYPQAPGTEGDAGLLASAGSWPTDAAGLRQQINDYLGPAGANVELICTENNSVFSNPGKQTTSLVNGLFMADSFFQLMKTEFKGMVWWDFRNGQETTNNNSATLYGWRSYGDYGVTNRDIPSQGQDSYPTYYALKLMQYVARPGDQLVACTSDYNGVAAYAVKKPDGKVNVLLINKHPTANLPVDITYSGFSPSGTAYIAIYGKPQDNAAQAVSGNMDVAHSTMAVSGSSLSYTTASYSLTSIGFNPPPLSLPGAPTNLSGAAAASQVNLTWTDNANNEAGYRIDYTIQFDFSSGVTTVTAPASATSYAVTGLSPSSNYYFRVRAFNAAGDSGNSNSINVRTPRR